MQNVISARINVNNVVFGIQALLLEKEAYPALDELTSKISTLNLERVRQIKSRLVAISGRVQKVVSVPYTFLLGTFRSLSIFSSISPRLLFWVVIC